MYGGLCSCRVYPVPMTETQYGSLREKIAAEKAERLARYERYAEVYAAAHAEGLQAGYDVTPTPMVVSGYENAPVMDGVCGFAWVTIMPGNSGFARWLTREGYGRKAYGGGVQVWIRGHGQSYTRKYAHAVAMADYLNANLGEPKVRIFAGGRLD